MLQQDHQRVTSRACGCRSGEGAGSAATARSPPCSHRAPPRRRGARQTPTPRAASARRRGAVRRGAARAQRGACRSRRAPPLARAPSVPRAEALAALPPPRPPREAAPAPPPGTRRSRSRLARAGPRRRAQSRGCRASTPPTPPASLPTLCAAHRSERPRRRAGCRAPRRSLQKGNTLFAKRPTSPPPRSGPVGRRPHWRVSPRRGRTRRRPRDDP
mmetsp:Transcript_10983/g.34911  ORF Transcript_10983/g.34911 Transcript_10983/m.34911 type:complete len:216 (-) Transcript_10983:58-705(-)